MKIRNRKKNLFKKYAAAAMGLLLVVPANIQTLSVYAEDAETQETEQQEEQVSVTVDLAGTRVTLTGTGLVVSTDSALPVGSVDDPEKIYLRSTMYYNGVDYDFDHEEDGVYYYTVHESGSSDPEEKVETEVTVKCVDAAGNVLKTTTFTVKNSTHTYYPATTLKVDGVYYDFDDSDDKSPLVADGSQTEYTIRYSKSTGSYTWNVYIYDSSTNTKLATESYTVENGQTVEFDATSYTIDGYTVNAAYNKVFTHTYGDSSRTTNVYYDPEGYDTSEKTKYMILHYVDLGNNNALLDTEVVTVTTAGDTSYTVPSTFTKDGTNYVLVNGQSSTLSLSYYSPRARDTEDGEVSYTIYYRDEANTDLDYVIIKETTVTEVVFVDRGIRYIYTPNTTTVEAVNTQTGQTTTLQVTTENSGDVTTETTTTGGSEAGETTGGETSGSETGGTQSGSETTGGTTGGNAGDEDVTIEGVTTPGENIELGDDETAGGLSETLKKVLGAGGIGALIAFLIVLANRMKKKAENA